MYPVHTNRKHRSVLFPCVLVLTAEFIVVWVSPWKMTRRRMLCIYINPLFFFLFLLGAEKIRSRDIRASDAAKRSAEARRERGGRQEHHAQPFHSLQACPHQGRTSCRKAGVALP
jgi:hypothetical protein